MNYPEPLLQLITLLKKLPGVGNRTAERFAFDMVGWEQADLNALSTVTAGIKEALTACSCCGCFLQDNRCHFCDSGRRDSGSLCVIASPRDVYSVEETGEYRGLYHVLGGLLNPLQGRGPEELHIAPLRERAADVGVAELIIALDSTLEGDATALYLKQELDRPGLSISRLAFGLPMGSSLDYVDGGTLARALMGRRSF